MSEKIELSIHLSVVHFNGEALSWGIPGSTYVEVGDLEEGGIYLIDTKCATLVRTNPPMSDPRRDQSDARRCRRVRSEHGAHPGNHDDDRPAHPHRPADDRG